MSEIEPKKVHFTYEERNAIAVVRKSMRSKPEIITEIMKGGSYALAERVLIQAKTELNQQFEVNRAFIAAASELAKQHKESLK